MEMNDLIMIIGALGGFETIKWILRSIHNRKNITRQNQAQADHDVFVVLKEINESLSAQLAAKEKRFQDQIEYTRAIQDKLDDEKALSSQKDLDFIKAKSELEIELFKKRCEVKKCPKREPENGY